MVKILNLGLIVSHSYKSEQWIIYQFDVAPFTLKESEYLNPKFLDKFMNIMIKWLSEKAYEITNGFETMLDIERWRYGIQIFNWYHTPVYNYKPNHEPNILFRIIEDRKNRIYVNDLTKVNFNYIFEGD